ncbi:gamma-glutamyltransferase 1 [Scopulibacillus darangshiensis]|uniref:Glutathione hydrolase proenzyme n=1 Tax=Scopulibacillus darangshiensis TaxID=442528 RepID=A0A4R2PAH9_9BACL|nr:gamma-glutamyltransferase [Scopulibacillus darangshiensis]TCP30905.1 gamma-glutamyltransferase 1 [Scopulibacillus darangshiensis]
MRNVVKVVSVLLTLCLLLGINLPAVHADEHGKTPKGDLPKYQVDVGTKGMVATAHPEATKIGADVLRHGGNAVDAAIAIQFALNVSEPMMSGIGGGGFMMVYDAKKDKTTIIDSREKASAGSKPDMFLDKDGKPIPFDERVMMGDAVGVPGTLKGLETAYDKWGTVDWKKLVTPAEKLAKHGVKVNWVLADAVKDNQEKLSRSAAKNIFLPNGEPLQKGDKLVQKDLAKTLNMIEKRGSAALYHGPITKALASTVQKFGGTMTEKDLSNYDVTVDKPLMGTYRGYKLATMPPPSSGGLTVLQILKLLEGYDMKQYGPRSPEKYNLLAEAMHVAYADRGAYIGDPKFVDVPMKGMLDDDYIAKRRQLIELGKANKSIKPGDPWAYQDGENHGYVEQPNDKKTGETTHFTVADQWGNLVSYTTTIEQEFGTGIMVPGYGFMLNNEMTDFDAVPGGANQVKAGKRPMSSMSPTIVFDKDGNPFMTVGSPGGKTIITSVAQTIINVIDYGMAPKQAIEEQRIYSPDYPDIRWEQGVPENVRGQLEQLGYKFDKVPRDIGNVQMIRIYPNFYLGAADSTRQGRAQGIDHVKGARHDHHNRHNDK